MIATTWSRCCGNTSDHNSNNEENDNIDRNNNIEVDEKDDDKSHIGDLIIMIILI